MSVLSSVQLFSSVMGSPAAAAAAFASFAKDSSPETAWAPPAILARHQKASQAVGCPSAPPFAAQSVRMGSTAAAAFQVLQGPSRHRDGAAELCQAAVELSQSAPSFASCWGQLRLLLLPLHPPHRPCPQYRNRTCPCPPLHWERD